MMKYFIVILSLFCLSFISFVVVLGDFVFNVDINGDGVFNIVDLQCMVIIFECFF